VASSILSKKTVKAAPTIEFKRINPTKYRLVIHNATDNFPLIFSESFDTNWRLYLINNYQPDKIAINDLVGYKIIDDNADDQATVDQLKNYLASGYISTLGDLQQKNITHDKWQNDKEVFDYNEKFKIDFISQDFQGTIQNDNLPNGNFYETWFEKPIDDNLNHQLVNGYANSWEIDPSVICGQTTPQPLLGKEGSSCVKNADGSYDFEIVIEFWPQRLFYIGLGISGLTLLGCLAYLGYYFFRRKKKIFKKDESGI
jgi:hypothetical protein